MSQGKQEGRVYAYSTADLIERKTRGESFPMKIGTTTGDVPKRIKQQKTGNPDDLLQMYVSDPTPFAWFIEQSIHKQLRKEKKRYSTGGTEWFMCSLKRVGVLFKDFNDMAHA